MPGAVGLPEQLKRVAALSRFRQARASAQRCGRPGTEDSVGDGLLRALLEPGFVEPPQVPHARRREYRSNRA
jgi:hypothetical protein